MNGNILLLMSYSMGIPLNQILALGFRSDGRELLEGMYEAFPNNKNKFDGFMFDLEKIYSIDKLIIAGYGNQLAGIPLNLQIQNELIEKTERDLASNFIANYETDYIMENYQKVYACLTTERLKQDFMNVISQVKKIQNETSAGHIM